MIGGMGDSLLPFEAQPFLWSELTEDQQHAVAGIHRWLAEFVRQPRLPKPQTDLLHLARVDQSRPCNVVLIDGTRGSGKTAVLLTCLDLWTRSFEHRFDLGKHWDFSQEDPPPDQLVEDLAFLRTRILPLQILDLAPVPKSAFLIPWLASRLWSAVAALGNITEKRDLEIDELAQWDEDPERELSSRSAWRELIHVAAAGGDGNVRERSASLDPEAYAIEVEQAEISRANLVSRWRQMIEALIRDAHHRYPREIDLEARIVIPIDDADMRPDRCVELLRMMRDLWHPQVVFLLTGNSELFQASLRSHFRKDFDESDEGHSRRLARDFFDKVAPPTQRLALKELAPMERLERLRESEGDGIELEPVDTFEVELSGRDAFEYLALNDRAQSALPDRIRALRNLRLSITGRLDPRRLSTEALVLELWRLAIEEENLSGPADKRRLDRMVRASPPNSLLVDLDGQFDFTTRSELRFGLLEEDSDLVYGTAYLGSIDEVEYGKSGERREGPLSERLVGTLLLASDVAADGKYSRFAGQHPVSLPTQPEFLSVEHTDSKGVFGGSDIRVAWPLPDWHSAVDYIVFDARWREVLRAEITGLAKTMKVRQLMPVLAMRFVETVIGVQQSRLSHGQRLLQDSREGWTALFDAMFHVAWTPREKRGGGPMSLREKAFVDWSAGLVATLAAPEMGLPPQTAAHLLESWLNPKGVLGKPGPDAAGARMARRSVVQAAINRGQARSSDDRVDRIIYRLNIRFGGHPWLRMIGSEPEPPEPAALPPKESSTP
jgi:hypothetical protein